MRPRKKLARPAEYVCDTCGLPWDGHSDTRSVSSCVALLKAEVDLLKAEVRFPKYLSGQWSTTSLVGERGPELVNMTSGSRVTPSDWEVGNGIVKLPAAPRDDDGTAGVRVPA